MGKEIDNFIETRARACFISLEWAKGEMNLAEFPLATLADRVPPDSKTLVFEDRVWDRGQSSALPGGPEPLKITDKLSTCPDQRWTMK